jgi:hypothetical protein
MSFAEIRIAPGFGACDARRNGAQASPPAKLTSCRCFQAVRYDVGSTAPSYPIPSRPTGWISKCR